MSKGQVKDTQAQSRSISDKEMIQKLVSALEAALDTPTGGPHSVGDWKKAETMGRNAIALAKIRGL